MSGRTVVVPTSDHGEVTVSEPAWCLGLHLDQHGGNRADIAHDGPLYALRFRGRELLGAALVAYPFAESSPRGPAVAVDLGGDVATVDLGGLRELAVGLIDHAAALRHLARELEDIEEAGR